VEEVYPAKRLTSMIYTLSLEKMMDIRKNKFGKIQKLSKNNVLQKFAAIQYAINEKPSYRVTTL